MIDWFELHGIRIIIIVAIGVASYLMFQYFIPRFVRRTVSTRMKEKPGAEIQKRTHTLSAVLRKTTGILLGIIIVFTILAEMGINRNSVSPYESLFCRRFARKIALTGIKSQL